MAVPAFLSSVLLAAGCTGAAHDSMHARQPTTSPKTLIASSPAAAAPSNHRDSGQEPTGTVTLGFAGDVHFAGDLAGLLRHPRTALAPIAPALRRPDLMMVNLETAITKRGRPYPKEYHFRTSPVALQAVADSGVDVVTMANNHAVDYGAIGLKDTLRAVHNSPIPVVGIGTDAQAAFRPFITSIRGTRIAIIGATTLPDETAAGWAASKNKPGVAVALLPRPRLTRVVHQASRQADVVVVYLHWGDENVDCPYWRQRLHAHALARAGADIIVGSHAHVLLGTGWLHKTYVSYGLGNFVWYDQSSTATGILTVRVRNGRVVRPHLEPALIGPDGRPRLLARIRASGGGKELASATRMH